MLPAELPAGQPCVAPAARERVEQSHVEQSHVALSGPTGREAGRVLVCPSCVSTHASRVRGQGGEHRGTEKCTGSGFRATLLGIRHQPPRKHIYTHTEGRDCPTAQAVMCSLGASRGGIAPGVVTHVSHLTLAHGHTSKPGNDRIFAFQGLRATLASPAVCVVDSSPSDLGVGTGEPWSRWLRWSPGPEVLRLRFASCSVLNARGVLGKVTLLSSGSSSEQGEVWTSLVSEAFT